MKKVDIIEACSDLGVHKDGAELGPDTIITNIDCSEINKIFKVEKEICVKQVDKNNKRKNIKYINRFNKKLYNMELESLNDGNLPIALGGDHSIAIATALASIKKYNDLGIIWIDSHSDYHTLKTTVSGNIHGLPFASITGQDINELTKFHNGNFYNPLNSVLVGARSVDYPGEYDNLKKAGVKVFTTEDIKNLGMNRILDEAFIIAGQASNGIHISLDVDVIDPKIAPGVSIPEVNGINEAEFEEAIKKIIENKDKVKSIDLVEYNPQFDINNVTLNIVKSALNKLIDKMK